MKLLLKHVSSAAIIELYDEDGKLITHHSTIKEDGIDVSWVIGEVEKRINAD